MTLDTQITETQKALDDLTADEAELSRLLTEKAGELSAAQVSPSRDYAARATLEGQHAALSTMLGEHRDQIRHLHARLGHLIAQRKREGHLDRIAALAEQIRDTREALHLGVRALRDALEVELHALFTLHRKWGELRSEWQREAAGLGVILDPFVNHGDAGRDRDARNLWAELEARGVDTDALRLRQSPYMMEVRGGVDDRLPLNAAPPSTVTPYPERLDYLLHTLFVTALASWYGHVRRVEEKAAAAPAVQVQSVGLAQAVRDRVKALQVRVRGQG